ncbi:zinc-dependent metalloprotease [Novosphingobium piscinae]|uniref:Zinc-dependent metalloprotease n=1 Tax=Novosphingobium piscinae TaxID=1507448 RepID=A0A7X1KQM9_9SPHN|nr:zinc-dependent metalloprotease [Novosphingobium piscinae]MBC2669748.1 zinc-dependent metalloprotease [Novosphingobium piscinae]
MPLSRRIYPLASASALALIALSGPLARAQAPTPMATPTSPTAMRMEGFVPLVWDAAKGRMLIEVPAFDTDILYYVSAASGGGSVELPLDRGILDSAVIRFQRAGSRVLVVEINTGYRTTAGTAQTATGVADSFPTSVLASLPIESTAGGKIVVDATGLFLRDAAGIEAVLRRANQGGWRFDPARSAFHLPATRAFPDNSEVETIATFAGDAPGALVRSVTPDPRSLTLRIHHSFLKAPSGYVPRLGDPRIGVSELTFRDYAKEVSEPTETKWITRWRLEKKNPSAALSEPVKPITFYFDPAIPAPIRTAMKQGTLWWNKAFEQAGFINAVRAEDAPADMDPMDIRYAYVLWINRDERGFSSGGTYRDPRTGEILGSKTRMDTHRIRTIANYWDAYTAALPADGSGVTVADPALVTPGAFAGMPAGQRDMVLVRQALLTAHELGHALGFQHNFASSLDDRQSVMEYPSPRVKVAGDHVDLSEAFQKQIGAYDKMMVRYAYSVFAPGAEKAGLAKVIADMRAAGLHYVPDTDPRWTWYDDRATPTAYLRETYAARSILLKTYGQAALTPGEPVGALRDARLWMVYLHHRYAIESAAKYVGGLYQNFVVKGDTVPPTEFVPAALQREVLGLLLDAVQPAALAMPESLLAQLVAAPGSNKEDLSGDPAFDQLQAARIATALVLEPLTEAARANRMLALAARQKDTLTFPEMVDAIVARTLGAPREGTEGGRAVQTAVQSLTLDALMILGAHPEAAPAARGYVLETLQRQGALLAGRRDPDRLVGAWAARSAAAIARYLEDPAAHAPKKLAPDWGEGPRSRFPQPPGPPLG